MSSVKQSNKGICIVVLILIFSVLPKCWAQMDKARISGRVTDNSGAFIPGASVVARNVSTHVEIRAISGSDGNYVLSALDPGSYSIDVSSPGFETVVKNGIEVHVAQLATVDVELPAGQVNVKVEVTAAVPLTDTQSGSLGQVLSNKQIVDLPLNGRNFYQLAGLTTGAVILPNTNSVANSIRPNYISGMTISGVNGSQVGYLMDGVDVSDNFGGTAIQISIDAIQEFKVQQNAYSSEFNRAGGVFNITTKSGTNTIHGNVYEFIRNEALDAKNYFALFRSPLKRNQFGATFGSPITIPHLYNGKDKAFVFMGYDGTRQTQGVTANDVVPTQAMLNGDFSAAGLPAIYDPLTTSCTGTVCTRKQISSGGVLNVIPKSRLSPQALYFNQFIPAPNLGGTTATFNPINRTSLDQGMVRVDYVLNTANRLSVRANYLNNRLSQGNAYPALGSAALKATGSNLAGTLTTIIGPNTINEFRASYLTATLHNRPFLPGTDFLGAAGIIGFAGNAPPGDVGSFPDFSWSGYSPMQGTAFDQRPKEQDRKEVEIVETWTHIQGRNVFKAGVNAFYLRALGADGRSNQGLWSFTGVNTQNPGKTTGTGNPFADWMLGYPATVTRSYYANWFGGIGYDYHFFVQDDIKVNSHLTVNAGIRYEVTPWLRGYKGQLATFDPTLSKPIVVGGLDLSISPVVPIAYNLYSSLIQTAAQAGYPTNISDNDHKQFAPRLGFAWSTNDAKTVVRGGYGIFYEVEVASTRTSINMVPWFLNDQATTSAATIPTRTFANFFLGTTLGSNATTPTVNPTARHLLMGYDQHFNLGIQQSLGSQTLFEINYVGNKGVHLASSQNFNLPTPAAGNIQARRPYPLFAQSAYFQQNASSEYSSLQAKLERRASRGWWYLVSYTWSKNMYYQPAPQLGGNSAMEWAPSSFDIPQNLAVSVGYELPFGRGKALLTHANTATNTALGGWQIQGVYIEHSGVPFTPTISTDVANVGLTAERPIWLQGGKLSNPTVSNWFNRAVYAVPAQYTYGNAHANSLRSGTLHDLDMSLFKVIPLHDRAALEFRYEVFNVTNTANFLAPSGIIDSSTGATVTATSNDARQMQFAAKISF